MDPVLVQLASPLATRRLGKRLGQLLQPGDFVALLGDLGAGKTLFTRGVAEGAEVPESERTSSPTFALCNVYRGGRVTLQHLDLYRLGGESDLFALGFDDLLREPAATLVEWADRAGASLPEDKLQISLTVTGPESRRAALVAGGKRGAELLEQLRPRRRKR